MYNIKKDTISYDEFIVMDKHDNPVTGLVDGDFTKNLFDPDNNEVANISAGVQVTIIEVGNGLYRLSFTPNKLGNWGLIIYNTTYFPWGKGDSYKCVDYLNDDLGEALKILLGFKESYRMFNQKFDRNNNLIYATAKIYPTANDCNNNTNFIAEYEMTANFDLRTNLMNNYKVIKLS